MPKQDWTPEQRAAFAAKMKTARAAKKIKAVTADKTEQIVHDDDVRVLLRRIEELEKRQFFPQQPVPAQTARTVVTKFSFNPKDYPDPRDRFFTESRLKLKGFNRDWWDLGWEIQRVNYEEDGIKYAAPRFVLELYRIIEDEVTGEPTARRYTRKRGLFFEDPDSYIAIANQHGVDIPENFEKEFLNEMRYLSMLDFLIDIFYPPKSTQAKSQKTETVIGNRLVEVFEVNTHSAEKVTFDKLSQQL
jgi:hypothetical protein